MNSVLDASVLVKLLVREPGTDAAQAVLARGDTWIAPDWIMTEVASALSQKVRHEGLPEASAMRALEAGPAFLDRMVPTGPLRAPALALSIAIKHAVYDCFYLVLAEREGARVLTADVKLVTKLAATRWADRVEALT